MKLYLISQDVNNDYDTFDSAVVAAEDEESARLMHPKDAPKYREWMLDDDTWAGTEFVKVKYIGEASGVSAGVICASFSRG